MTEYAGSHGSEAVFRDGKTEALSRIIRNWLGPGDTHGLVVGCGSGLEAAILAQELGLYMIGVDLEDRFDPRAAARVTLRVGDARTLEFADRSFDLVFSYHALEHIPEYRRALSEMRRVLRDGGVYCIGTPNRLRWIGYIGSKDMVWSQKVRANVDDYTARARGRFRNEFGAHAGFSPEELRGDLEKVFGETTDITLEYYRAIYRRWGRIVVWLHLTGLGRYVFPSIYFIGRS
jgi:SAM-dependent methyltransferase